MKFTQMLSKTARGFTDALRRFPLTSIMLTVVSCILCYMVGIDREAPLILSKITYALLFGAILSAAAELTCERFCKLLKRRLLSYIVSFVLTSGYFLILLPAPKLSMEITVRTLVAVFAIFSIFLWIPSYGRGLKEASEGPSDGNLVRADFNRAAITHFKFIFTSVLYALVLWGGLSAIVGAIDLLLFKVNSHMYLYMAIVVWVLFAPIYYLSLLPRFNSGDEKEIEHFKEASKCPGFLVILISYIFIPLITAYTAVLAAYFIKILVTLNWPSGQIGIMVLIYSAVGIIIYVLSSLIENRFCRLYLKVFPKVLIPVVIMQLVSVAIRLNAYGITESRYYVALFGVFSLVCGVFLSIRPKNSNGAIAVLAACFALLSIIPPIDAFTVSRVSQTVRIENILKSEGMLSDGTIIKKPDAGEETKIETTNILNYLYSRGYLSYIKWLPSDFNPYNDMRGTFGFEETYRGVTVPANAVFVNLDATKGIDVSGYAVMLSAYSDGQSPTNQIQSKSPFKVGNSDYFLIIKRLSGSDAMISIQDTSGNELISTSLYDKALAIAQNTAGDKSSLSPEDMSLTVQKGLYSMKVIFQNFSLDMDRGNPTSYSVYVLFNAPK